MSDFVDFTKRNGSLPEGCTDLIDLLRNQNAKPSGLVRTTTQGLRQLEAHLARFLSAPDDCGMLSMLGFDLESAVYIQRAKQSINAVVVIKTAGSSAEAAVRAVLRRFDMVPVWDEVPAGEGGARVLECQLSATFGDLVVPVSELLRAACSATEHAGLYYDSYRHNAS